MLKKILTIILTLSFGGLPLLTTAQTEFNPHLIISDEEIQNYNALTRNGVQQFLNSKGSYLRNYRTIDAKGIIKPAADIIYEAAISNQINPKFLLVTLQKEQSLITDKSPTTRQLNWATGYAVCDGCYLSDPKVVKHKGFGKQIDGAAGVMRWYYDNKNEKSFIKKKNQPIIIDSQQVIPQSWATAFLYTYTPHLHGNKNFWRIWQEWFVQLYPNGTLLQSASSNEYWLIQDGKKRKIKNKSVLMSRTNPKLAVIVQDIDLSNYPEGAEIAFSNYSLLKTPSKTYLLDYDTLRPFASDEVVRRLGYNPQEIINVSRQDIAGYKIGNEITISMAAPQGVIYQITDLNNTLYLLKNNILYPLLDNAVADSNFKNLPTEKHKIKELAKFETANVPITFNDGTLLKIKDNNKLYVIDKGKKRNITNQNALLSMGYKTENLITVKLLTALNIPKGEPLYIENAYASLNSNFLGDSKTPVANLFPLKKVAAYLVAEYPSGKIISGKNIDNKRPIATFTKLLTAYEALQQNLNLSQATTYQSKKHSSSGNPLRLVNGEKIKNLDLFNALLLGPINNVARMVSQSSGLSEKKFILSVNNRLKNWGANKTSLAEVTGLNKKNISTPRDMLKIFVKVLNNNTVKTALSQTTYSFRELVNRNGISYHKLNNSNDLMFDSEKKYRILASKNGYTSEAGAVLAMLIEDKKNKNQYVVITMGNKDYAREFKEPHKLAEWAVSNQAKISLNQ